MRFAAGLLISVLTTYGYAHAQDNCSSIPDPQARLACFDKGAPRSAPAKKQAAPIAPKAAAGAVATDSGWELRVSKDKFTDEVSCIITPTGRPWIQISVGNLFISYRGRGGVKGYTLRIDDNPPGQMRLASPLETQISMVNLSGDLFVDSMAGNRLRVQTFTVLNELKDEDIELGPVKRLYKKMGPECERPKRR